MITEHEIKMLTDLAKAKGYDLRCIPLTYSVLHSYSFVKIELWRTALTFGNGYADVPTGDETTVHTYAEALDTFESWIDKYEAGAKPPNDIRDLKSQWLIDPCWDIESSKGFEFHHDELLSFHNQKRAEWKNEKEARLVKKAEQLGVPGNLKVAAHVFDLEYQIRELQNLLARKVNDFVDNRIEGSRIR